ncbi:MAG TPA: hypothetical protein VL284_04230 [Thermoanaerobaculia bacterium]|nr:hypothetical protein [Thermoanaerobaculia bacterium]
MKSVLIGVLAIGLGAGFVIAQEHPEHPTGKTAAKKGYSMDDLEKAITAEIENAQKSDGYYHVKDGDKTWNLKLDHVHKERLARTDETTYFACTDFKSDDGHTVDVDFFMKDNGQKLVLADTSLHKVDGKPRYNWKEKDGYWVKEASQ